MARLQGLIDRLTEELGAAADHVEMARVGAELAVAQAGLGEAEERWLLLAEGPGPGGA